ncbi:MAG: GAF domain-containing protein [bacterium]
MIYSTRLRIIEANDAQWILFSPYEPKIFLLKMMWQQISADLDGLLDSNDRTVTTLANAAAFLCSRIPRINWLGFYFLDGNHLYLGPFTGKPACTSIEVGKGVCGTSALIHEVIVVPNVDQFPGHIACDEDSRSEIVLPIILPNGDLFGVLDVDSAELSRFSDDDKAGLEAVVSVLRTKIVAKL